MFNDPISLVVPDTLTLNAVSREKDSSVYKMEDGSANLKLTVSHAYRPNRSRYVARFDVTKTTTDPFVPATNIQISQSVYVVFDRPNAGFSVDETSMLMDFLAGAFGYVQNGTVIPTPELSVDRIIKGET